MNREHLNELLYQAMETELGGEQVYLKELLIRCAGVTSGDLASELQKAYAQVGEQEAHHLFHTQGWARELWIDFLGMEAVMPPPEEEKKVKTQIGAARAEQQRDDYK